MKIWVYVEGSSDARALTALWEATGWLQRLKAAGHGIKLIALNGKPQFFTKLGCRAAQKLADNNNDRVVGLPDLYPNAPFRGTCYEHAGLSELQRLQTRLVKEGLERTYSIRGSTATLTLDRFFPSALKHDLEMLLLAAHEQLRRILRTTNALGNWRRPVEEQNQARPPKRIVEELFRTRLRRAYRDTKDARCILEGVEDIRSMLYTDSLLNCPVFKEMLDYIGRETGVPAYQNP